jgi:hypothetical protein
MNHFFTDLFQNITIFFLPVEDVFRVMLVSKTSYRLAKSSHRFALGAIHHTNPVEFHYYIEKINKPITLDAYKMVLNTKNKKDALERINNLQYHLLYHFIDLDRAISCLWSLPTINGMLYFTGNTPVFLLYKGNLVQINYKFDRLNDDEITEDDYVNNELVKIQTQESIIKMLK